MEIGLLSLSIKKKKKAKDAKFKATIPHPRRARFGHVLTIARSAAYRSTYRLPASRLPFSMGTLVEGIRRVRLLLGPRLLPQSAQSVGAA
jgi:hypothetical protein